MTYFQKSWRSRNRHQSNFLKLLSVSEKICLYDLGSAGGVPPPFCYLTEIIDLINFEPDPRGISERNGETLPIAIGPKELDRIYLNKRAFTSSLLRPNMSVINRYDFKHIFPNENKIFKCVATQNVETFGLDEIIISKNLPPPDFLKIDVQGLSMEVLESADKCLSESIIGIQVEVEFLEVYKGQKIWSSVINLLGDYGYELFRINNISKWYYKTSMQLESHTGQDIFCDLLFFKNIDSLENKDLFWNLENSKKAILLFLLFDLPDTAASYLYRMYTTDIINDFDYEYLRSLITKWLSLEKFLFKENVFRNALDLLVDVNIRSVFRTIKKVVNRSGNNSY